MLNNYQLIRQKKRKHRAAKVALLSALSLLVHIGCGQSSKVDARPDVVAVYDTSRIVSINGAVTEVVYALNSGSKVVGVDTSSVYPEEVTKLPKIGYQRRVSAEGILSLRPSLVIATTEAGPPEAIAQLQNAGVSVLVVTEKPTVEGARERIRSIARALQADEVGQGLIRALDADLERVRAKLQNVASKPKVLFIYARGQGTLLISGAGTSADEMIKLAGGVNAVTGYQGFRPLTAEAVVAAAPDIVLLPERGLQSIGGAENLLALPGLRQTPAGKNRLVIAMDDLYLLGFGPRTGRAVEDLALLLHPELRRQ